MRYMFPQDLHNKEHLFPQTSG